jgi:hypothetical protein
MHARLHDGDVHVCSAAPIRASMDAPHEECSRDQRADRASTVRRPRFRPSMLRPPSPRTPGCAGCTNRPLGRGPRRLGVRGHLPGVVARRGGSCGSWMRAGSKWDSWSRGPTSCRRCCRSRPRPMDTWTGPRSGAARDRCVSGGGSCCTRAAPCLGPSSSTTAASRMDSGASGTLRVSSCGTRPTSGDSSPGGRGAGRARSSWPPSISMGHRCWLRARSALCCVRCSRPGTWQMSAPWSSLVAARGCSGCSPGRGCCSRCRGTCATTSGCMASLARPRWPPSCCACRTG